MKEEVWKDIPGYEGLYMASNYGEIMSLSFPNNFKNTKYYRVKILKQKVDKQNSKRVELWKDGKHKTFLVHRLIATTFLENYIDTNMTVNHKDGNRLNNNVDNLEWMSLKENIQHGFKHGLYKNQKQVVLKNKNTLKEKKFASLSEASQYMHYSKGYLSEKIIKGIYENKNYSWEIF